MQVAQRAEEVFLKISSHLGNLQRESLSLQDRLAKKTKALYQRQAAILFGKSLVEGLSLVGSVAVFSHYQKKIDQLNQNQTQPLYKELKKKLEKTQEQMVGAVTRGGTMLSALTEPVKIFLSDIPSQATTITQQENSTFQGSLSSIIQTHETALQRLQNIESSAKAAG